MEKALQVELAYTSTHNNVTVDFILGSSTGSSSRGSSSSVTIAGSSRSATSYGSGGGKASTIPSGQIFAGRIEGGGTRDQVFGSRCDIAGQIL